MLSTDEPFISIVSGQIATIAYACQNSEKSTTTIRIIPVFYNDGMMNEKFSCGSAWKGSELAASQSRIRAFHVMNLLYIMQRM